jgi:DNA-binding NarL/FixJ family response regulator
VARVVAFIPDLLFGSNVLGALNAAGHEAELTADPARASDADVLVVDLTADAEERIARLGSLDLSHTRTLAFYSHVETDVRERAQAAGFDLVVPRSRMAREGSDLVTRLAASVAD